MYRNLRRLCGFYSQDHDLLYEKPTDPIDQFCAQNDVNVQKATLQEMVAFLKEVQSGKKSLQNLVDMGLEWVPGESNSFKWFESAIDYLSAKLQRM